MCLIREAASQGNIGEAFRCIQHHFACPLDPSHHQVPMRGLIESLLEGSIEVSGAELCQISKLADPYRSIQSLVDKGSDLLDLPPRKTSPLPCRFMGFLPRPFPFQQSSARKETRSGMTISFEVQVRPLEQAGH